MRKRTVYVGVACLLLLMGGVVVRVLTSAHPAAGPPANQGTLADKDVQGDSLNVGSQVPTATDEQEPVDFGSQEDVGELAVLITIVDAKDDVGISKLPLRIGLTAPDGQGSYSTSSEHVTDERGQLVISAVAGTSGLVELTEPGWRLATTPFTFLNTRTQRVFGFHEQSRSLTITVERYVELEVQVRYADGVPYSGAVQCVLSPSRGRVPQSRDADSAGRATFEVSVRESWIIAAPAHRPGFEHGHAVFEPEVASEYPARLMLELPPVSERENGVFEVDLAATSDDKRFTLLIHGISEGRWPPPPQERLREELIPGGQIYTPRAMPPGLYTVTVLEGYRQTVDNPTGAGSLVWRSDVLTLEANRIKRVTPRLLAAGVIKATIVSAIDGKPLVPAIMHEHKTNGGGIAWHTPGLRPPGSSGTGVDLYSMADEHGKVALSGVFPGELTIEVEGKGHEIRTFDVTVGPGQVLDLGTIVLQQAQGKIEIIIHNRDPDATYQLYVFYTFGVHILGPVEFTGNRYVIENIPPRMYSIALSPIGGRWIRDPAQAPNVELTETEPHKVVEFMFTPAPSDG
jgi:hypothetical protein